MNVEIGIVSAEFLFWEYLFQSSVLVQEYTIIMIRISPLTRCSQFHHLSIAWYTLWQKSTLYSLFITTSSFYHFISVSPHCNENPIYVFLFWELRGLSPDIHISHRYISVVYVVYWILIGSSFAVRENVLQ
jgi:hypothetical protein